MLKGKLKTWNHGTFSIVPDFIKEGQKDLQDIQGQIQTSGYNDNFGTLEKNAQIRIEDALKRQNWFWKEKARMKWHDDGDFVG